MLGDDGFRALEDGGRASAIFGTQGALMLVLSLRLPPGVGAGDSVLAVEARVESERYPDGIQLHERRELRHEGDDAFIDALFVVVEYVGPKFDLEQARTVSVSAWAEREAGESVCRPASLALDLDIVGEPYVLHPRQGQ